MCRAAPSCPAAPTLDRSKMRLDLKGDLQVMPGAEWPELVLRHPRTATSTWCATSGGVGTARAAPESSGYQKPLAALLVTGAYELLFMV
jgi:hypothetical protein